LIHFPKNRDERSETGDAIFLEAWGIRNGLGAPAAAQVVSALYILCACTQVYGCCIPLLKVVIRKRTLQTPISRTRCTRQPPSLLRSSPSAELLSPSSILLMYACTTPHLDVGVQALPNLTVLADKYHAAHQLRVIELLNGTLRLIGRLILHQTTALGASIRRVQHIRV
jgi:hypothetical protein